MSSRKGWIWLVLFFICQRSGAQADSNLIPTIDRIFQKYLHQPEYIPGGIFAMVSADTLQYCKGYGLADLENEIPFDAGETVVRLASVTKLITTTAVLQLMEQGKIDIEKPVLTYCPEIRLKNPFAQPVLVKHLLTHTAGFDDRASWMEAETKEEILPLDIYNQKYLPAVVWEPGRFFNYSNYAFNLLAYLVQKVSGLKFEEYVFRYILMPLEMEHSGFGYAPALTAHMMKSYKLKANDQNDYWSALQPLTYTNLPGADDFKTTAVDMAHFISMYLNGGKYKNHQLLQAVTIARAFETHFTYDPMMAYQQGLGWRIRIRNGTRMVYHYGDATGIESSLVLFPDRRAGFFAAFNNQMGYDAKVELLDSLFYFYYADRMPAENLAGQPITPPASLTGDFMYMNDGQNTFEKIGYLFGDKTIHVTTVGDTLLVQGRKYVEVSELLFSDMDQTSMVKFCRDDQGRIGYLSFGTSTYKRVTFWERPALHRWMLAVASGIIFIFLGTILVRTLVLSFRKSTFALRARARARWVVLNGILLLLFFVFMAIVMRTTSIGGKVPLILGPTLTFPVLALMSMPMSLYQVWVWWKRKIDHVFFRCLLSLTVMAMLVILILLHNYNLLGYCFY